MVSIAIQNGAEVYVRRLVPTGIECYVLGKQGERFLKVRTSDPDLIATLKAAAS